MSIDAGGDAAGSWLADGQYSGGDTFSTANPIDTALLPEGAPPASVLQTERYGEFTYTISDRAAGSEQAVTLYFVESYWSRAGQRTFDVSINGKVVLSAFDIFEAAGGADRAIARTFTTTADASGRVVVEFTRTGPDNPKLCGLTVTGEAAPPGGSSSGGSSGGGSSSGGARGPCDIYAEASTPCVAAHSTVRALYAAYAGPLYQVRRSDGATRDVPVQGAGGFVDVAVQDAFCAGSSCTISILYDQSPNANHLRKAPPGATWLPNGGLESSATKGRITVSGHTAFGIYVTADNVAYRNNQTRGVATGDQAEAMYMVVDGRRHSSVCCFDYGNAETNSKDNGNGTMEAVYWGTDTTWGGKGDGNGPWIAADLENGVFKGDQGGWQTRAVTPSAKSILASFATAMLKGPSGNHFALKGGDAQSGRLVTMWDGPRPSAPGYSPKHLEGAIILGTGGDGSNGGTGTFYEGAMTRGNPPDAVDDAIQANIVAAGYGR